MYDLSEVSRVVPFLCHTLNYGETNKENNEDCDGRVQTKPANVFCNLFQFHL